MSQAVYGAPLLAVEGETKALATTAGFVSIKPGFHEVKMYCASQWRLALSPKLVHCLYFNGSTYTDYVQHVTDRLSTTHLPLDGMTTSHYVYLGTTEPILGVYIDMGTNVNDQAATLDVEYCSTAVALGATIAFTDVAGDSDGTDTTGTTLSKDGVYTWTLPGIVRSTLGTDTAPLYKKCYWMRFKPSATLAATLDIDEIIPVYKNVNYAYMEPGLEYQFAINTARVGGFVVLATAGTPTLDVSWVLH